MNDKQIKQIKIISCIIILGVILGYQIFNILCNTYKYVNSDFAIASLLANEQIKTRQLLPEGFHYSTGVFVIYLNLLVIPFMLFIKDWLLCSELAVIVQTIIGILLIFIFFKKTLKKDKWIFCAVLSSILILLPLSYHETYYSYYEAVYFTNFIFELIVMITLINYWSSSKVWLAGVIYLLAIIGTNLNSTRNIILLVAPILLTIILYLLLESQFNLKKLFSNRKGVRCIIITVAGTCIAYILFKVICIKVELFSEVAGITFASSGDIGKNILSFINSLFEVYGASGNSILISYSGIMNVIKFGYAMICIGIVPVLAIISYRKTENYIVKLIIIFLIISNLCVIYMCIFTTAAGVQRYVLPIYYNNILLLILCIQSIKSFWNKKYIILYITGIFSLLAIKGWEENVKTRNESNMYYELVDLMYKNNIKYGYADFWDAYVTMMLSNGEVTLVGFQGSELTPFYWLTSQKWYEEENYAGRHCILTRSDATINEKYYIMADEIVYHKNYVLLIFNNSIIRDLPDISIATSRKREIPINSLYFMGEAYRYSNKICLKKGGIQYGPYIHLDAGYYQVEIIGNNLTKGQASVTVLQGKEYIDFTIVELDKEKMIYTFKIDEDMEEVEFAMKNDSDEIIYITSVELIKLN